MDEMEVGEMWDQHRKDRLEKKRNNLEYSTGLLRKIGINFDSHNGGVHLVVKHGGLIVDFWPSTGKFNDRRHREYRRGIKNLIKHLKGKK